MSAMPAIHDYSFGRMTINKKVYTSDLIILPDGTIADNWYRRQGHYLIRSDIESLLELRPEIIVIGTGASGRMQVDPRLLSDIEKLGLHLNVSSSGDAVTIYNRYARDSVTLGACFHLTC